MRKPDFITLENEENQSLLVAGNMRRYIWIFYQMNLKVFM